MNNSIISAPGWLMRKKWPFNRVYWSVYPVLYRRFKNFDVDRFNAPINPLRIINLSPKRINLMTGRPYPQYLTFNQDLGSVIGGDWDQPTKLSELREISGHNNTDPKLYHATRFEDSLFHKGMVERFEEETPWEETRFYQKVEERIKNGNTKQWQSCCTRSELNKQTEKVDLLFNSIKKEGYTGPKSIISQKGPSLIKLLKKQILIDIGRDGEPRFVDGRHRLSIAKILGVHKVPVVVVVRHKKWMRERDLRYQLNDTEHFDFFDSKNSSANYRFFKPFI